MGVPSAAPTTSRRWQLPGRPSVTVIVATRDRRELLARAIDSIWRQDYEGPVDCVVVFDQCTPHELPSGAPAGRSVRGIVNERRPGLAGARNTGILGTSGDLVAFCDDDDEWEPDKLTRQIALLRSRPDACFAATGIRVFTRGREVVRQAPASATFDDLLISRITAIHPSSFLVLRDALVGEIGLVDESIPGSYGEDYDLLLRAARLAPVVSVPGPLVRVHWTGSSFFADRWATIAAANEWLLEHYPEFGGHPRAAAFLEGKVAFARAAAGDRAGARQWARRALRHSWKQHRAYAALLAASGVVRPDVVMRTANALGRGI
jgi:hypothetical protein